MDLERDLDLALALLPPPISERVLATEVDALAAATTSILPELRVLGNIPLLALSHRGKGSVEMA